jgi:thiosulfate/3-mercaptopyruvate sulfurtransferase
MSTFMPRPLITADELQARLDNPDVIVLDIRADREYEAGHVPGAVHSPYETGGWRVAAQGGLGMLPTAEHLSGLFGRLGIAPGDAVAIMSAGTTASDLAAATRVYWTLKAARHSGLAIVDGGYAAWQADALRRIEKGPGRKRPETT